MEIVTLVSGGIDSLTMCKLLEKEGHRHSAEKSSDIIFFEILPENPYNLLDLIINVQDVATDVFINKF